MKKALVLAACLACLFGGVAQADVLDLGPGVNWIPSVWNGVNETIGGGSFDVSTLNGQPLKYIYCVDYYNHVYLDTIYNQTTVTSNGMINGALVNNAGEVAWLLKSFASSSTVNEAALQAAIWKTVYPTLYNLQTSATFYSVYESYLTALDGNTASYAGLLWITPGENDLATVGPYQGLVAAVPEPGTLLLLGAGLLGLAGARRKFRK